MRRAWASVFSASLCALLATAVADAQGLQAAPAWPDTFVTRLEALALMQGLNAEILASPSATLILEKWCGDHRLAAEPKIVAHLIRAAAKTPTAEQRQRLQVADGEVVTYRRVELLCGRHVLSVADNWYVPSRLTAEMNQLLETTDTPFGTAVRALEPYRQTVGVKILWSPLSAGWEREAGRTPATAAAETLAIPEGLFEHQAVLYTRDHQPFSEVDEVYQRQVLAFPPPPSR